MPSKKNDARQWLSALYEKRRIIKCCKDTTPILSKCTFNTTVENRQYLTLEHIPNVPCSMPYAPHLTNTALRRATCSPASILTK